MLTVNYDVPRYYLSVKVDQSVTGVEASDLQAGDVILFQQTGRKIAVSQSFNMAGKTFVSFHGNNKSVTFDQNDLIDIERRIWQ